MLSISTHVILLDWIILLLSLDILNHEWQNSKLKDYTRIYDINSNISLQKKIYFSCVLLMYISTIEKTPQFGQINISHTGNMLSHVTIYNLIWITQGKGFYSFIYTMRLRKSYVWYMLCMPVFITCQSECYKKHTFHFILFGLLGANDTHTRKYIKY